MTDEELAKPMSMQDAVRLQKELEAQYVAQLEAANKAAHALALERDAQVAKAADERMARYTREETAATLLAALIQGRNLPDGLVPDDDRVRYAVALADALRKALRGGE